MSQPNGQLHQTPGGHPERPARLEAVEQALAQDRFGALKREDAQSTDLQVAALVHGADYLETLRNARPGEGIGMLDQDTYISSGSFDAASTAIGAGLRALDAVLHGEVDNAFCAIRPPGHHAEKNTPMGFCLFNTIAIVAREAQRKYGAERVAIIDFDVHHGNGTQEIFWNEPRVLYASTHQSPLYPGTGARSETGVGNIVNVPLAPNAGSVEFRDAYARIVLPALEAFKPQLILISAGFDAHRLDPLAQLDLVADDYAWITARLVEAAARHARGRVVSGLEGGYSLTALGESVAAHVAALMT